MNDFDDDLVTRSLAYSPSDRADGAERRKASFQASLAALEADPAERARIDRIATEAGITDQDDNPVPGRSDGMHAAEALVLTEIDMSVIAEAGKRQEQVSLILQNTLQMQDKLIAQGQKMREAMEQIEEHASAAAELERTRPQRIAGPAVSQISMPAIVVALIGAITWLAVHPSAVAGIAALTFAGVVAAYAVSYMGIMFMSARALIHGRKGGERVLRLLLGSLSVEERLAEARASTVARALRNAPPDDSLTLQVGTTEDPDIIELTRGTASRTTTRRNAPASSSRTRARAR